MFKNRCCLTLTHSHYDHPLTTTLHSNAEICLLQWTVYRLQKEKQRDEHQIQTQGQEGEGMEEDTARKRAKLDDCQLEASDGHRGEGSEVVPSGTHGSNTQTHSKSSFSPHICIHTGTQYPFM